MIKVGLTGNICSGKSTVASIFRDLGAFVFDADKIIHRFYQERGPVYERVVEVFGKEILSRDGSIDRKKLAQIVFRDKQKLKALEEITHKALYEKLEELFSSLPNDAVAVVEASLIIEKGTYKNYDKVVVVYAPYELCLKRCKDKGFSEEDFKRRWSLQMPPEEKVRFADFVIDNSRSLEETRRQVMEIWSRIKK